MVDQITDIIPSDKRKLKELFHRFSHVISVGVGDLGQTKLLKHAIKTGDMQNLFINQLVDYPITREV